MNIKNICLLYRGTRAVFVQEMSMHIIDAEAIRTFQKQKLCIFKRAELTVFYIRIYSN